MPTNETTRPYKPFRCVLNGCMTDLYASIRSELVCEKCGNSDREKFIPLANIHLVLKDKDGPIKGVESNLAIACEAQPEPRGHYSDDPTAVTCKDCLEYIALSLPANDPEAL